MGGGDLNLKKSWHPNTMKNQERVWKAEQADAAEKRKLAELKQEISAERDREELHRIGQSSGVLPGGLSGSGGASDKKLEWMYKGNENLVNREEYLMGRQVDKSFEAQVAAEREAQQQALVGVTKPKNHVEHECIPFSIRQFHGIKVSEEQVDLQRKISEDPLMAIRQREMETRKKLLENPVKLKEIHRLLRTDGKLALKQKTAEAENVSKKSKKSKKSSKKSKKSKKKKKRHSRSSENDSSDASGAENEADLDAILAKKYKQLQGDEDGGSMDIDKLLKVKYNKLSEELDKMGGAHTKKKKKSKRNDVEKVKSDKTSAPTQVAPVRRHANPFSKKSATENDLPMLRVQGLYPAPSRRSPSPPKSRFNQSPPRPKRQLSRSPIRSTRKRSPPSRGSSRDHKRRSSSRDQFNRSKELKRRLSPSRKDRSRSRSLHKSSRRTASPANRRQSSALRGRQSPDRRQRSPLPRHRSPISSNKSAPNKEAATTSSYSGRKLTSQERRARSRSPHRSSNKSKQTKRRSTSSSASSKTPEATPDKFKTVSSKKPVTRSRSSASPSSSSSESTSATTDSEAEAAKRAVIASRNYGLVTAGGEKIAIKPTATSTTNRSDDAKKSTSSRKPLARHERPAKLSEEEKQKRLLEMQSNAEWRDTERRRNVSMYREEENREKAERAKETFDRDYINKELHKAMANQHSVESRLRANKNNIQRSSGAMDSNFAKR